jgi:hypothetical protein
MNPNVIDDSWITDDVAERIAFDAMVYSLVEGYSESCS